MPTADEFFAQWLRMRDEVINSDAYKEEKRAREALRASLQEDIDVQYPGKKLGRWWTVKNEDGSYTFMVTLKD